MDSIKTLEELNFICHRAYTRGLQTGSGGNVSARIIGEEKMYVKASGSSFGDSEVSGFVVCDFYGKKLAGIGNPTREAFLHGLLYRIFPNVNAVFHSHSPYSIVVGNYFDELPLVTWHSRLKIETAVPVIDISSAMVRPEDEEIMMEKFKKYPNLVGFILKKHGIVVLDKSPIKAEHMAELFEETSKIAVFDQLLKRE